MKHNWNKTPMVVLPATPPVSVSPEPIKVLPEPFKGMKCHRCFDESNVMYEGSSWCDKCFKEKLRTGR